MYKSFAVKNFRNFSSILIENMQRINLIIGKNNAGKTAFLEAMFLHIGSINPALTASITQFRGITGVKANAEALWGSLFHNFDINKTIELTAVHTDRSKATLKISLIPSSLVTFDEIDKKHADQSSGDSQLSLLPDRHLQYKYTHKSTSFTKIAKFTTLGLNIEPSGGTILLTGFFVPARISLDPGATAQRFGELEIKLKGKTIVNFLKIIEPRIKSLTVIPLGPVPYIHADIGGKRLMPIQLLGEGMVRLSEIAIDISSASGGIVLVDDIDTGIHHSVLPIFWKAIFQLTKKLNVQLFASTHSAESLEAAHRAWNNTNQYDMAVYRLQRVRQSVDVISYDKQSLKAAIETGLEVR
ncbi:ATP/GTP-binding protein [Chloroflexota bacterium]